VGLHIMGLQTREKTSRAVLIGLAGIAVVSDFVGMVLLSMRRRADKQG
jgi:anti-anti-sigma regulatory factor